MGVYDQVKQAFQDVVAPEIQGVKGEIRTLQIEIKRLDEKIDSTKNELLARMDALDSRIHSLEHELRTAMDIRERLAALEAKVR